MPLPTHGRYPYSPIRGRPVFDWPNGSRLAFYVAVNLEHFSFGEGLGAKLVPEEPAPDVVNFSWRDYGNRVGVWRLLDLLEELNLPSCALVNTAIYDYCPETVTAFRKRGDEIVGHGRTNAERQAARPEAEEARLIAEATERLTREEAHAPAGWLGPWISESRHTPDLLQEHGYRYLLDWCMDDQPVWFQTRKGRILSVPYPQELNDIPAFMARKISAGEFSEMIVDQFDEMVEQSQSGPLVMGIALHPYIVGQPFRLRALRRALKHVLAKREKIWCTRPGEIAAAWKS